MFGVLQVGCLCLFFSDFVVFWIVRVVFVCGIVGGLIGYLLPACCLICGGLGMQMGCFVFGVLVGWIVCCYICESFCLDGF